MEKTDQNVKCPVCSGNVKFALEYTLETSAGHFCSSSRDQERNQRLVEAIAKLWEKGACLIYRCETCHFGFGYPFRSGGKSFYSILHEQMDYPKWNWDYSVGIDTANLNRPCSILDIGAGVGHFLARVSEIPRRHAIESDEAPVRALRAQNIQTHLDLGEAKEAVGSFEMITMFQTLEHIAEFEPLLNQIRECLAPEGTLLISVPDGDAMFRQEQYLGCPDMPPNHICRWTPESLTMALNKAGLDVTDILFEPRLLRNVVSKLHLKIIGEQTRWLFFLN